MPRWYLAYEDRSYKVLRFRRGDIRLELLFYKRVRKYIAAWVDLGGLEDPWHTFKKPTKYKSIAIDRAKVLLDDSYSQMKYIFL